MHAGSDMGAPGFSSRRPNASSFPNIELPPPGGHQKYGAYAVSGSQANQTPGSLASVGNLLTPPTTVGGDQVPSSSASGVNHTSSPGPQSYHGAPGGFNAWSQPHPLYQMIANGQNFGPQRQSYSPASSVVRGHPNSPPTSENGHNQHGQHDNFSSSGAMSAPSAVPSMSGQSQPLQSHMLGSQAPVSGPQQPSPVHAQEAFRPPHTPSYYSQAGTPQHQTFQYSTGPSPHAAPLSAGGPLSRPQMSPASTGPMTPLSAPPVQSPHAAYQARFSPFPPQGPVVSNLHNPNGQPMIVGMHPTLMPGFNSGHAATIQGIYGPPQAQPSPQNDRPFKCDQCPQSFNRNHDLKRHKRIHLAVKPFPCGHCDKSFSRKDALKRHVLVKGCGKAAAEGEKNEANNNDSMSPKDIKTAPSDASDSKPSLNTH